MNSISALSAFIIGIAGGDNITLQHLDHLIAWETYTEKQETLTVKPTPVIRYQIGKPYLAESNISVESHTPAKSADTNLIADIIVSADNAVNGCAAAINNSEFVQSGTCAREAQSESVRCVSTESCAVASGEQGSSSGGKVERGAPPFLRRTGLSQADIDKRVAELMKDNSTLYFSTDGKPLSDNPLKDYNRLSTVYFFINSPTTTYKIDAANIEKSKPVYLLGFASPDGEAPRLQTELAKLRAEHIKSKLEKLGCNVRISGAALCNRCWQVEIYQ